MHQPRHLQRSAPPRHRGRRVNGSPLLSILFFPAAILYHELLLRAFESRLVTLLAIGIGMLFYAAVLLLCKGIYREDVLMLPGGEKIAKILEKHGLIG